MSFFNCHIGEGIAYKRYAVIILPVQVNPFPPYPGLHAQTKLPGLLIQTAFVLQPPLLVRHSLISLKIQNEQLYFSFLVQGSM
jgi:hypothetical protein